MKGKLVKWAKNSSKTFIYFSCGWWRFWDSNQNTLKVTTSTKSWWFKDILCLHGLPHESPLSDEYMKAGDGRLVSETFVFVYCIVQTSSHTLLNARSEKKSNRLFSYRRYKRTGSAIQTEMIYGWLASPLTPVMAVLQEFSPITHQLTNS